MALSDRLRELRESRHFTQQQVGDRVVPTVTKAAVSGWESGKSRPRFATLHQLADLYNVTVADLLGEDAEPVPFRASGTMMPLLGCAHMGEPCDEDSLHEMVEVPSDVAERHPNGFLVHAQGDCMDMVFPHDCVLLVDPDMEPVNGKPVLAETSDYGAVVRNLTRGATHCMLTAASHSGEYPDIMAGPDDEPITIKGRVVWYMRDRDDRE